MRAYISDVEQLIEKKAGSRDYSDVRKWIEWAKDKVNWYDPYILQKDPFYTCLMDGQNNHKDKDSWRLVK